MSFRIAALAALCAPLPAIACPPPVPGVRQPTEAELVRDAAKRFENIVYGVVERAERADGLRFRVIHVYKGAAQPGHRMNLKRGWGLVEPVCASMRIMAFPPVQKGAYGVIAYRTDRPEFNLLNEREVKQLVDEGLIRSYRDAAPNN